MYITMMNIGGASRTVMIVRSSPLMITSNSFALLLVGTELVECCFYVDVFASVISSMPMFVYGVDILIHYSVFTGDFINEFC